MERHECRGRWHELLVEILQGVVDKDGYALKIYWADDRICYRDLDSDDEEEEEEDEKQPCYRCGDPLEEVDQVILNSQFMKPYCFECSELVKTDNLLKKELGDKYITWEEAEKQAKKTTPCEKCGKKVKDNEICVKDAKDLCFNCKYGPG
jgi:formylmethanofuran dehydrogenase subunit E